VNAARPGTSQPAPAPTKTLNSAIRVGRVGAHAEIKGVREVTGGRRGEALEKCWAALNAPAASGWPRCWPS
jgi:hypothetical protein